MVINRIRQSWSIKIPKTRTVQLTTEVVNTAQLTITKLMPSTLKANERTREFPHRAYKQTHNSQLGEGEHQNNKQRQSPVEADKEIQDLSSAKNSTDRFFFLLLWWPKSMAKSATSSSLDWRWDGTPPCTDWGDSHCKLTLELDLGWVWVYDNENPKHWSFGVISTQNGARHTPVNQIKRAVCATFRRTAEIPNL